MSPFASNPTSAPLWCCPRVGSPVWKKGEREWKQIWPVISDQMSRPHRKTWIQLDITNRLQVMITLAPYTHTLYLLSQGKGGHRVSMAINRPHPLSYCIYHRSVQTVPVGARWWWIVGLWWCNPGCFFSPTSNSISGFGRILVFENICTSLYQKHTSASRGLKKCCDETWC